MMLIIPSYSCWHHGSISFVSPLWFTTNWISITEQRFLCTTHWETKEKHSLVQLTVSGLDLWSLQSQESCEIRSGWWWHQQQQWQQWPLWQRRWRVKVVSGSLPHLMGAAGGPCCFSASPRCLRTDLQRWGGGKEKGRRQTKKSEGTCFLLSVPGVQREVHLGPLCLPYLRALPHCDVGTLKAPNAKPHLLPLCHKLFFFF